MLHSCVLLSKERLDAVYDMRTVETFYRVSRNTPHVLQKFSMN